MAASPSKNRLLQKPQAFCALSALWLFGCLHCVESLPEGRHVTCTAGSYNLLDSASIRCNFNRDLNATRTNFNVVHYHYSSPTESGTFVLLCNWQQRDELACKVDEGYNFNYVVNTRLKLEIPELTKKQTGLYVCQVVPDDGTRVEMCTLSVISEALLFQSSLMTTDTSLMTVMTVFVILIFIVVFYNSLRNHATLWTKSINVCKLQGCLSVKKKSANNKSEPPPGSHNSKQDTSEVNTPFLPTENTTNQPEESKDLGQGIVSSPSLLANDKSVIGRGTAQSVDTGKLPNTTVVLYDDQQRPHKTDDPITSKVSQVKHLGDKDGEENTKNKHVDSGKATPRQMPTEIEYKKGAQRNTNGCLIL